MTPWFANYYYSPLMPKALPEQILPIRLAHRGETLEGSVAIEKMPRLAALLEDRAGHVRFALRFGLDDDGQACVLGRIDATLVMQCQRCLEPMRVALECDVALALLAEAADAPVVDIRYEPLAVGDAPVSLSGLIEDELILALPGIARHASGKCEMPPGADRVGENASEDGAAAPESAEAGKENPFSILKSLKTQKSP